MMKTFLVNCAIVLAFATTVLVINSDLAVARQAGDEIEEIIVRAPLSIERHEVKGVSSSATVKTEIVELKRLVSFADLDLSRDEDVNELEKRIEVVAKDSCKKLSEMFPLDRSDIVELQRCTKHAIESTLEQNELAIIATH